jgi:hypothetical protein
VITTLKRWIVFLGLTTQGSFHDYELLKEELLWYEGHTDWFEALELFVDLGYLGLDKDFKVKQIHIPFKRPKKSKHNPDPQLTPQQKQHNKTVSQTRILVEHAIGSMKFFNILNHPYRNRKTGFEDLSIEICAALHNLYIQIYSN